MLLTLVVVVAVVIAIDAAIVGVMSRGQADFTHKFTVEGFAVGAYMTHDIQQQGRVICFDLSSHEDEEHVFSWFSVLREAVEYVGNKRREWELQMIKAGKGKSIRNPVFNMVAEGNADHPVLHMPYVQCCDAWPHSVTSILCDAFGFFQVLLFARASHG